MNCKGIRMKIKKQFAIISDRNNSQKFFDKKIGGEIGSFDLPVDSDFLMSPLNAAKYLDVSVKFIYELIQSGQIKSQPIGNRLKRIRKRALDNWLNQQAVKFER